GCRAAVCLISPTYIRSEYCGREFAALLHQEVPIFPVWWVPVREPLPAPLREREIAGRRIDSIDRSGLHALMRIQRYDFIYKEFFEDLAHRSADMPRTWWRAAVHWDETPNAFTMSAQAMIGTQVVAACVAPTMAIEGPGGWNWRPFGAALAAELIQRAALE